MLNSCYEKWDQRLGSLLELRYLGVYGLQFNFFPLPVYSVSQYLFIYFHMTTFLVVLTFAMKNETLELTLQEKLGSQRQLWK